jgi:hypothetical protein
LNTPDDSDTCICDIGYAGEDCSKCDRGFTLKNGKCDDQIAQFCSQSSKSGDLSGGGMDMMKLDAAIKSLCPTKQSTSSVSN